VLDRERLLLARAPIPVARAVSVVEVPERCSQFRTCACCVDNAVRLPHLDLRNRRSMVRRKGSAIDVTVWPDRHRPPAAPSAGRAHQRTGVLHRPPCPSPARSGRRRPGHRPARLSYRRAEELFEQATTVVVDGPWNLPLPCCPTPGTPRSLPSPGMRASHPKPSSPAAAARPGDTSMTTAATRMSLARQRRVRWVRRHGPHGGPGGGLPCTTTNSTQLLPDQPPTSSWPMAPMPRSSGQWGTE
jgi:hypothetical protein